jgi:hypothetical protein
MHHKRRNVEFTCRVKAAQLGCRSAPDQAVGADDRVGTSAAAVVKDEKVIATIVKVVGIAAPASHFGQRLGTKPFIEYPKTQRLRGIYVRGRFRQPRLQRAGPNVDNPPR